MSSIKRAEAIALRWLQDNYEACIGQSADFRGMYAAIEAAGISIKPGAILEHLRQRGYLGREDVQEFARIVGGRPFWRISGFGACPVRYFALPSVLDAVVSDTAATVEVNQGQPEFLIAIGSGNVATVSGWGESAVLSGIKGIPNLIELVRAGDAGVLLSNLCGVNRIDTATFDAAVDSEGFVAIRKELDSLQEQLADAREFGDTEVGSQLESQIEKIASQYRRDTTRGGKSRDVNTRVKSWRASFGDRIKGVYKQMRRQHCEKLANHFETSISTTGATENSARALYSPSPVVSWVIDSAKK